MLRTKLVVNAEPILSVDWNADSTKIVYTQHDTLCIKSLKSNIKTIRVSNRKNFCHIAVDDFFLSHVDKRPQ